MDKKLKLLIYTIVIGFVLTLVSLVNTIGFFGNYSNLGTNYGFPFLWLNYAPAQTLGCAAGEQCASYYVIWGAFFVDFVFWIIISFVILSFYFKNKK